LKECVWLGVRRINYFMLRIYLEGLLGIRSS
jgi:hypothetical protein